MFRAIAIASATGVALSFAACSGGGDRVAQRTAQLPDINGTPNDSDHAPLNPNQATSTNDTPPNPDQAPSNASAPPVSSPAIGAKCAGLCSRIAAACNIDCTSQCDQLPAVVQYCADEIGAVLDCVLPFGFDCKDSKVNVSLDNCEPQFRAYVDCVEASGLSIDTGGNTDGNDGDNGGPPPGEGPPGDGPSTALP